MKTIETAEYLVLLGDGATVLCERHARALASAFAAASQPLEIYPIGAEDEEGMATEDMNCQACHMAWTQEMTLQ